MDKTRYLSELQGLQDAVQAVPNSPYAMWAKVVTLATLNMRYERIAFDRHLAEHPYPLTERLIQDARRQFAVLRDAAHIEDPRSTTGGAKSHQKEAKHEELFNEIWDRYDTDAFKQYIARYVHRITINDLPVTGRTCVDLGCGNGVFCFALLECGAASATGIDFGAQSIAYAQRLVPSRGRAEFRRATVYDTGCDDNAFDLAIQNGVFHHLDDEDRAIREAARILKVGGGFWYYTDGEGGISYDLWDASVAMLRDVPVLVVEEVLESMHIRREKIVHLMDGLSATYAHTSWAAMTARLARFGFGNFRRLRGGFDTDCDLDVIEADPYGRAKFGEGDLRIWCELLQKPPLTA
jgi:ubiquinone/menaquinone biosynthesis C-methylase UbiE